MFLALPLAYFYFLFSPRREGNPPYKKRLERPEILYKRRAGQICINVNIYTDVCIYFLYPKDSMLSVVERSSISNNSETLSR